jgi:hypothetical protein
MDWFWRRSVFQSVSEDIKPLITNFIPNTINRDEFKFLFALLQSGIYCSCYGYRKTAESIRVLVITLMAQKLVTSNFVSTEKHAHDDVRGNRRNLGLCEAWCPQGGKRYAVIGSTETHRLEGWEQRQQLSRKVGTFMKSNKTSYSTRQSSSTSEFFDFFRKAVAKSNYLFFQVGLSINDDHRLCKNTTPSGWILQKFNLEDFW